MVSEAMKEHIACLDCGSRDAERVFAISYYPNKQFCPHEKDIEVNEELLSSLGEVMQSDELRCRGCGIDGPKGNCGSGPESSCGSCTCGKGGCGS